MDLIQAKLSAVGVDIDARTQRLLCELDSTGQLTLGWPGTAFPENQDLLVWFSTPVDRSTTSIVSSRLGHKLDQKNAVFRVLRSALAQLDPRRQVVLCCEGTTVHRFVERGCDLFGIPVLKVRVAPHMQSVDRWAQSALDQVGDPQPLHCSVLALPGPGSGVPIRDRIEVLESDQVLALHARSGGNLDQLLRRRLQTIGPACAFLAVGDEHLVPVPIANSLMAEGAVGWFIASTDHPMPLLDGQRSSAPAPILPHIDPAEDYLIHCTRRASGPWPNQSEVEYLDQLILGEPAKDRSSLAALIRIVRERQLHASGKSFRNQISCVSFTAAKIDQLSALRTFRPHRGRWDFEPYGICIKADKLKSVGAKQVIYGDEVVWQSLDASQRPYFQKMGDAANSIDWTVEQEWRVLGDVDLSRFAAEDAFVFVPTSHEAQHLTTISTWPVYVAE